MVVSLYAPPGVVVLPEQNRLYEITPCIASQLAPIVACRQPIARSGIELIRGAASDSALDTLVQRGLIVHNQHHLFVTTPAFLEFAGVSDLVDLPSLDVPERP
jgi:segregation and condensation protein B